MESSEKQSLWNLKYEQGLPSLTKADPFFLSACAHFVDGAFPTGGIALDLAGGLGRHALWLALRHWNVSLVDHSEVAIGKVRETARELNVKIDLFAMDATAYHFGLARFDLIVIFYYLNRSLFPKIVSALKPGGLLLCKLHVQQNSLIASANSNEQPLHENELVSLVPELRVVHHIEREAGDRGIVEFVGRKPACERKLRAVHGARYVPGSGDKANGRFDETANEV